MTITNSKFSFIFLYAYFNQIDANLNSQLKLKENTVSFSKDEATSALPPPAIGTEEARGGCVGGEGGSSPNSDSSTTGKGLK